MKKVLLATIFGVFLFAGTGLLLIANEPVTKETTAQKACCETTAKTAEKSADAGCTGTAAVQTASNEAKANECGEPVKTAAAGCDNTSVQTVNSSATGNCGDSSAVKTASTSSAGDCGTQAVKTSASAGCGGCGSTGVQTTQASQSAPGECVKRPAGVSPQRAQNQ